MSVKYLKFWKRRLTIECENKNNCNLKEKKTVEKYIFNCCNCCHSIKPQKCLIENVLFDGLFVALFDSLQKMHSFVHMKYETIFKCLKFRYFFDDPFVLFFLWNSFSIIFYEARLNSFVTKAKIMPFFSVCLFFFSNAYSLKWEWHDKNSFEVKQKMNWQTRNNL